MEFQKDGQRKNMRKGGTGGERLNKNWAEVCVCVCVQTEAGCNTT